MGDSNEKAQYKRSPQTEIKQKKFLAAFAKLGVITGATEIANVARTDHYRWMKDDPDYPAKFEASYEQAVDSLEQEAIRRARDGWIEPVFQGGKKVGEIRKRSDVLLIFMLKGSKPEKHRDRVEVSGQMNQVVQIVKFSDGDKKNNATK